MQQQPRTAFSGSSLVSQSNLNDCHVAVLDTGKINAPITAAQIAREMSEIVREAGLPIEERDSVLARIARAAQRLGISNRRARAIYYKEIPCLPAHTVDNLRRAHERLLRVRRAQLQVETAALDARIHGNGVQGAVGIW